MNRSNVKNLFVLVERPLVSKFSPPSSSDEADTNPKPANDMDTSETRVNPEDDREEEKEGEEGTNKVLAYIAKLQHVERMAAYHEILAKQAASKAKVELWLPQVPIDGALESAFIGAAPTTGRYLDRLNWTVTNAHKWLDRLDGWELRYRTAGLKYHKIPFPLRHTTIAPNGTKIEFQVLTRLAGVFNPSRPRDQQAFFLPWVYISDVATDIIEQVDITEQQQQSQPQTFMQLSAQHAGYEMILDSLLSKEADVEAALICVERMVERITERADDDQNGRRRLAERHSREGSLFRQWIQNFGEMAYVGNVPRWIETYVHDVLKGGLERERCWHVVV